MAAFAAKELFVPILARNAKCSMPRLLMFIFILVPNIPVSIAAINELNPTGSIKDYGIAIVQQAPQQIVKDKVSPSGEVRKYRYRDLKFIERTTQIPAKKGTRFGVSFVISNLGNMKYIPIQWKITHPVMRKPDGTTSTVQLYERKFPVKEKGFVSRANAYLLKYDYEVLPGVWVFEYFHNGQLLFSKKFILY